MYFNFSVFALVEFACVIALLERKFKQKFNFGGRKNLSSIIRSLLCACRALYCLEFQQQISFNIIIIFYSRFYYFEVLGNSLIADGIQVNW